MAKGFAREKVDELLVKCHRRCCICHRFCGTKIETDHIDPRAEGQDDRIENAITVCFECHAEIHSYNDKHPRGRKFRPEELRRHRDQWLRICAEKPEAMLAAARDGDVGPLQALTDELEFNRVVANCSTKEKRGALFLNAQFLRAVQEGMIAILDDSLKDSILKAYVTISRANQYIIAEANQDAKTASWGNAQMKAGEAIDEAKGLIDAALKELARFLASEASG